MLQQIIYDFVNIVAIACIKNNFFKFISINTEKISFELIYPNKNTNSAKWNLIKT